MKVEIERSFPMPCSAAVAWQLLQDIEAVAGCMPGAAITERIDATHYKGTISVRLGPATMSFKGSIEVTELDPARRSMRLVGKGADTTGTSGASMDMSSRVEASGDTCRLIGRSQIEMSGKAATFGGRMMNTVAEQILKQFSANFAARVEAFQAQQGVAGAQPAAATAAAGDLNGLALLWTILRDWCRSRFSANKPG